jgi:ABC-type branched-subunit amino acid transport system substrate-binding protein
LEEAAAQKLERNVIKIGVAGALKRPYGIASLRGAEMAAKEINDAGGVLGLKDPALFRRFRSHGS